MIRITTKCKGTYTWYSASSWIATSAALRYGTCCQGISQFYQSHIIIYMYFGFTCTPMREPFLFARWRYFSPNTATGHLLLPEFFLPWTCQLSLCFWSHKVKCQGRRKIKCPNQFCPAVATGRDRPTVCVVIVTHVRIWHETRIEWVSNDFDRRYVRDL